jgi:hypothetical protein
MTIEFIEAYQSVPVGQVMNLPNGIAKQYIDGGFAKDITNNASKGKQSVSGVDNVGNGKEPFKGKDNK